MLYDPKWEKTAVEEWRGILIKAADLIERGGLCKNKIEDAEGRHCLGGAIWSVTNGRRSEARVEAMRRMHAHCGGDFLRFNNAPERTADEVAAALREVALSSTNSTTGE